MAEEQQGYRVPDVCKAVGISYRQLDYWARTGLVTPSIREAGGSGTQRLYSFQDMLVLRIIKKLLDAGVGLQQIRKAVEYLKEMRQPLHSITLMSDGIRIYAPESPEAVIDLLSKGQGVFAIAVDKVVSDLEGTLAKTQKRSRPAARAGGG
ncbi:MAG: MerR family transcriptional regulator [Actinomycetota bacterium]